jgi:mono/diheme cytochrome c family protein
MRDAVSAPRPFSRALAIPAALGLVTLIGCGPSDPGERLWLRKCAGCHGKDGRGRTRFAQGRPYVDLTDGKWKHGSDRASILKLVTDGGDPASAMPVYRGRLSPEEIDAVVDHVVKLTRTAPATASLR